MSEAIDFSKRLVQAMLLRGYRAERQARSGVDIRVLQKLSGLTREGVRKWVDGRSVPNDEQVRKIAKFLRVRYYWLRDGSGTMERGQQEMLFDPLIEIMSSLESDEQKERFITEMIGYAKYVRDRELNKTTA